MINMIGNANALILFSGEIFKVRIILLRVNLVLTEVYGEKKVIQFPLLDNHYFQVVTFVTRSILSVFGILATLVIALQSKLNRGRERPFVVDCYWCILGALSFSNQKPDRRAIERDDAFVSRFLIIYE